MVLTGVTESFEIYDPPPKPALSLDFYPILPGEEFNNGPCFRKELYVQQTDNLNKITSKIISQGDESTLHNLCEFIKQNGGIGAGSAIQSIPTALLLGGYNGADRADFYHQLRNENSFEIVLLKESTSIKECMGQIINAFTNGVNQYVSYDIMNLVDWCKDKETRLVVVIPEFESFDPIILQKLIQIISGRRNELPICFVFGIATTINALQQCLPKHILANLNTISFELTKSKNIIDKIIRRSLLSSAAGVKLGWNPYRVILSKFLDFDFSVKGFINSLQYCIFTAYFGNPLSIYLKPGLNYADLDKGHFEAVRALPSVRNHIANIIELADLYNKDDEKKSTAVNLYQHAKLLITDNRVMFDTSMSMMKEIYNYITVYNCVFSILLKLQKNFEKAVTPKPAYYLYDIGLHKNLGTHEYIRTMLILFRKLKWSEIYDFGVYVVKELSSENIQYASEGAKKYCISLEKYLAELKSYLNPIDSDIEDPNQELILKDGLIKAQRELSMQRKTKVALSSEIVEDIDEDKETALIVIRRISDVLKTIFENELVVYTTYPMHEVVFFTDDSDIISKSFRPEHRAVLHTALAYPSTYYGCKCCETDAITRNHDDISILYKLHLECGKLVNLRDLYDAFTTIVPAATEVELQYFMFK